MGLSHASVYGELPRLDPHRSEGLVVLVLVVVWCWRSIGLWLMDRLVWLVVLVVLFVLASEV